MKVILLVLLLVIFLCIFILFFDRGLDFLADHYAGRDHLEPCDIIFTNSNDMCSNFGLAIDLLKRGFGEKIVFLHILPDSFTQHIVTHYQLGDSKDCAIRMLLREQVDLSRLDFLPDVSTGLLTGKHLREYWNVDPFKSVIVIARPLGAGDYSKGILNALSDVDVKVVNYPPHPEKKIRDTYYEPRDFYIALYSFSIDVMKARIRILKERLKGDAKD